MRGYRFSGGRFTSGVERHPIDGIELKDYDPEKTRADCFAFRNSQGMDVVLEALDFYRKRRQPAYDLLLKYARICRVENIIRPYLEATA